MKSGEMPSGLLLLILFILFAVGLGVQGLLAYGTDEALTAAQSRLFETADWLVKASVGAMLGLVGGARLRSRTGGGASG